MRLLTAALAGLMLLAANVADASVSIIVDKTTQTMTVVVDGAQRYQWPVSTGNPSHETPGGRFKTFRMEEDHYSKEFDDAPMPHAIFFTKYGHAIHGTDAIDRLGSPASHGCVRLSRENAATLFALVQSEGVLNTTVELSGSSRAALTGNSRTATGRTADRQAGVDRSVEPRARPPLADEKTPVAGYSAGQQAPAPADRSQARNRKTSPLPPTPSPGQASQSFFSFLD